MCLDLHTGLKFFCPGIGAKVSSVCQFGGRSKSKTGGLFCAQYHTPGVMPSGESNPRVGCLNGSCELACCKPPCDTLSSRPLYTAHSGCTASTCGARPRRRDLGPVTTRSRARVTSKCTHPSRVTDDIPAALDDGKGGDRTGLCPRFCRRGEASSRRHNALHRARGRRAAAPSDSGSILHLLMRHIVAIECRLHRLSYVRCLAGRPMFPSLHHEQSCSTRRSLHKTGTARNTTFTQECVSFAFCIYITLNFLHA